MEVWKILLLDVLTIVEFISLCFVILKKQCRRGEKKAAVWLLDGVLLYALTMLLVSPEFATKWLFVPVVILLYRYIFEDTLLRSCIIYVFTWSVCGFMESAVSIVVRGNTVDRMESVLISVIVTAVLWLYHLVIGRKMKIEAFQLPLWLWGMVGGIMLVLELMFTYFEYLIMRVLRSDMLFAGNVLIVLGGVIICGLVLTMVYYFNGTEKFRQEKEMAEYYNEQQREHFTRLLDKEQNTRQFRHDIINHLVVMEELCGQSKYEDVQEYIKKLLDEVNHISHFEYSVGNDTINIILNYYLLPIKEECQIEVTGSMGKEDKISQKDMCTVVSNLVKNAVEAVSCLPREEREICALVEEGKEGIRIRLENTFSGVVDLDERGIPKTMKQDVVNHGYGIRNVMRVVEQYHGIYETKVERQRYIVDVTLNMYE